MTVEHLIALLMQQDPKALVAIYDKPEAGALVIPNYDEFAVDIDEDFSADYDLPANTVFITGK